MCAMTKEGGSLTSQWTSLARCCHGLRRSDMVETGPQSLETGIQSRCMCKGRTAIRSRHSDVSQCTEHIVAKISDRELNDHTDDHEQVSNLGG